MSCRHTIQNRWLLSFPYNDFAKVQSACVCMCMSPGKVDELYSGVIGKKGRKTQRNAISIVYHQEFCTIILIVARHDTNGDIPVCTCNPSREISLNSLPNYIAQKYHMKILWLFITFDRKTFFSLVPTE